MRIAVPARIAAMVSSGPVEAEVAGEVVERAGRDGDEHLVALDGHGGGGAQRAVAAGRPDGDDAVARVGAQDVDEVVVGTELVDVGGRQLGAQVVGRVAAPDRTGVGVHGEAHAAAVGRRAGVGIGDAAGSGGADVVGPGRQHDLAHPQPGGGEAADGDGDQGEPTLAQDGRT